MAGMDEKQRPYTLIRLAQRGVLPDKRTRIGQTIKTFCGWIKGSFPNWNKLQEARLQIAVPYIVSFFSLDMYDANTKIRKDYLAASNHLERLIKDVHFLSDKSPASVPNLQQYLKEREGKKA